MKMKRSIIATATAALAAFALVGCTTAGTPTAPTTTPPSQPASSGAPATTAPALADYLVPAKPGPYKVALANSFAGNTWRAQMVQEYNNACQNTYAGKVTCLPATDANNDLATQVSQITDFISQGVDILLIDAADAAGLNAVIEQAHKAGIQVVDFDGNTTSQYAIHVGEDQVQIGRLGGQWLASQLKSGDEILNLTGIAGNPVSQARDKGALEAIQAAGLKVVGSADTKWDKATAQQVTASLLAAHPNVKGIYSQGGDASLGAIAAMQQLGMKLLPIPGEASNGFLKNWQNLAKNDPTFKSWAFASPPSFVVDALDAAIKALGGTDPGQNVSIPVPEITAETLGQYVRPDLNDSLWLPTSLPDAFLQANYKN